MNLLRFIGLALVVQLAPSSPQGTASIEGVVVKLGTTDAVVDADVELSRVEGVVEAPMTDAATAFFKTVLDGFGPSGAFPPAVIANEVNSIARVPVEVRDRNIDNLFVSFESGLKVAGRVVSPGPIPAGLRVVLRQDPPMLDADKGTAVAPDGTFTVANVPSGSYRVWVTPILTWSGLTTPSTQPGLYVTSIVHGQTDVLNDGLRVSPSTAEQPLTITVGSTPGMLQGRVADNQGRPAAATWVALIPEGLLRFRTAHKFASSDAAGRFQIGNVPPGNYRAYAWMDAEKDDWQDPAFVERYAALGAPVQLGEGATVTLELIAR